MNKDQWTWKFGQQTSSLRQYQNINILKLHTFIEFVVKQWLNFDEVHFWHGGFNIGTFENESNGLSEAKSELFWISHQIIGI